ncbi:MAG: DEAD/DEAH box helicase [Aquabacterium sp.]|uniref:DEAD/DEAH box helicase n=1 Tax=Aquabacterium sp. TaxID=1872578 RepID=UPI0011F4A879|nr:DEAD/DEAH box helicase [Aquabacterium sp.]TAK98145.1 MAG: DEAD/DEAH box helicase [Aquabacterium sp.]
MSTSSHDAWRFRPRLTLHTLSRGDGLLGMQGHGRFGPRGPQVTVARIDWTYAGPGAAWWSVPAPSSVLYARHVDVIEVADAQGRMQALRRDPDVEAEAFDQLQDTGLQPLPHDALQWRAPQLAQSAGQTHEPLWSLLQEDQFGDFWLEQVPALQAKGWSIVVRPGFAHQSTPVANWRLIISQETGEPEAKELIAPLQLPASAAITPLGAPRREGSWLVTLGVEVDGQQLDLAPLIADLIKRDKRWLNAADIADIADDAIVILKAPGGKRIEARAAPLKAIVGAMVDLLMDPRRREGPIKLQQWDAVRVDQLREQLMDTQAARAGRHGAWQLQGEAGLHSLTQRLRTAGTPQRVPDPAGLGVSLRPYQQHGVAWLQYLREQRLAGILADDMGLGKTAQALAHLLIEKQAGRLDLPALIVMPTSLVFNWQAEARRMAPSLRVLALQGPERGGLMSLIPDHDVVLTTYPLVWRDIERLAEHFFHVVILDEAQTVKNAASKSAAAIRRLQSRHRLCLTGTPLENHLGELWAQFDFLMPSFLGDMRSFQRQWRDPIEQNGETLRAQLLAQRVRPFILRRRKVDVLKELPPKTEVVQQLQLEGQQKTLYESVRVAADEMVRKALNKQGFEGAQIAVLDALLKLRQVCCDPWLVKGRKMPRGMERAKLAWLCDTLPSLLDEGRRVLVFSQFSEMLGLIADELVALNLPFVMLTGETLPAHRADVVRQFQEKQVPLMLVTLKAGGVGLNLTAADTVIHVDPWWNPAVEQQATDRAHRIGQDQPVTVYKLVVAGSIEERIQALQARKSALAEGVLGEDGALAIKFSQADLDALLAPLA